MNQFHQKFNNHHLNLKILKEELVEHYHKILILKEKYYNLLNNNHILIKILYNKIHKSQWMK